MQKSKKHILGAIGLASVAGMTIVAHGMPAPVAYAETSSDVPLKVTILAEVPAVEIGGDLQDGGATSLPEVTVPVIISQGKRLRYTLTANQNGKSEVEIYVHEEDLPDGGDGKGYNGSFGADLKLKELADKLVREDGYATDADIRFTLTVTETDIYGGSSEASIVFTYGVVTIDPNTNINDDAADDETNTSEVDPANGDPIIVVETGDEVEKIHVVVRDPNTGEVVWEGDFPAGTDVSKITLPFAEDGIPSGNYDIEIYAYDESGNLVGTTSLRIRYARPDGIGLPNTGGSIFAGLNIGEADFLVSGALVFFFIGAAGIYLIRRSTKSRR